MSIQINASIITIGDELLIGQTIDTNSAWIGQQLNAIGIWVKHRIAVGDVKNDIFQALEQEEKNADLIIITGGLGPTADDITKPLLCEYFGGTLKENEKVKQHVIQIFEKRKRKILDVNIAQAMVPNNCDVLWNEMGTAPGMWFKKNNKIFISLPGVPFEMKNIMLKEALPKIKTQFKTPQVIHRTCCTAGIGESFLADELKEFEKNLPVYIKLAYLPQLGGLKLRLTGINITELEIEKYFNLLCSNVSKYSFANEDTTLEKVVGDLLIQKKATIAFAESCTGGGICARLTSISGASNYCNGAVVSYTNEIKINSLQVQLNTLNTYTAVSEEVAIEMANGVLNNIKSTIALSITGYLEKNLEENIDEAKCWIAITNGIATKTLLVHLPYQRIQNCEIAIQTALNNLRLFILEFIS